MPRINTAGTQFRTKKAAHKNATKKNSRNNNAAEQNADTHNGGSRHIEG